MGDRIESDTLTERCQLCNKKRGGPGDCSVCSEVFEIQVSSLARSQSFAFKVFSFVSFLMHVTNDTLDQRNGYILTADKLPSTTSTSSYVW